MVTEELREYANSLSEEANELIKSRNLDWSLIKLKREIADKLIGISESIEEDLSTSYTKKEPDNSESKCPLAFNGNGNDECRGKSCMFSINKEDYSLCAISVIGMGIIQSANISSLKDCKIAYK